MPGTEVPTASSRRGRPSTQVGNGDARMHDRRRQFFAGHEVPEHDLRIEAGGVFLQRRRISSARASSRARTRRLQAMVSGRKTSAKPALGAVDMLFLGSPPAPCQTQETGQRIKALRNLHRTEQSSNARDAIDAKDAQTPEGEIGPGVHFVEVEEDDFLESAKRKNQFDCISAEWVRRLRSSCAACALCVEWIGRCRCVGPAQGEACKAVIGADLDRECGGGRVCRARESAVMPGVLAGVSQWHPGSNRRPLAAGDSAGARMTE